MFRHFTTVINTLNHHMSLMTDKKKKGVFFASKVELTD